MVESSMAGRYLSTPADLLTTTAAQFANATGPPCPLIPYASEEKCATAEDYENEIFQSYVYPDAIEWFLSIPVFAFLFLIGLIGNFLVCFVVLRNESMRTVTNIFLVNLAVADFLVILLCMPFTVLWDISATWFFGTAFCKIIVYTNTVSVAVSVLTLTAISVERWYAICHPLAFKATFKRTLIIIGLIWVISLIISMPEAIVLVTKTFEPQEGFALANFSTKLLTTCGDTWGEQNQQIYQMVQTIVLYFFPLFLMLIMYGQIACRLWAQGIPSDPVRKQSSAASVRSCAQLGKLGLNPLMVGSAPKEQKTLLHLRQMSKKELTCRRQKSFCSKEKEQVGRRKAAKMLIAVVILFAICYLPTHVKNILGCFGIFMEFEYPFDSLFLFAIRFLCYFNSCINPLVYNFMSEKFRKEYQKAFVCWSKHDLRRRSYESQVLKASAAIHGANSANAYDRLSLLSSSNSHVNRNPNMLNISPTAEAAFKRSRSDTEFRSGELEFRSEVYPPLSAVL